MSFFAILLKQISIKDLFDIGIVSLMIYQMLKIVHGTRAVQILIGLVLLSILYFVGINYKFYTVNWILEHFFNYFFIIFIILFQDQLRAALATVGTGKRMFQFFDRSPVTFNVEEIVRTTFLLSREKTGALIVIERSNGLENYIETGTRLDAEMHSDLMYSIFQSISPLHDGAIIIRSERIAAAGCFLPLSKTIDIDRNFGTRHRAALGISEVSDAVTITVSEESGNINVCMKGKFYKCVNENDLRMNLKKAWRSKEIHFEKDNGGLDE